MSLNDFLTSPKFLLHELVAMMDKHANSLLLEKFKLNLSHFKVLLFLLENPDLNQKELSICMTLTESGISKTIANLKELGLLETIENPENRREHQLKPTVKGNQILEEALKVFTKETDRLFSVLTDSETTNFNNSLKKLISQF